MKVSTIKHHFHPFLIVTLLLILTSVYAFSTNENKPASAGINDSSGLNVGVTYYGGNFDDAQNAWVIDNQNQCTRISNGEFSAASLDAVVSPNCNDDNGLGYLNDIPLHNTVSFAELSNNPNVFDASALGNLPAGTKLEIKYQGRCVVAEKRDIGGGGGPVNGVPRALDLWWQTARAIGFTNGWDTMSVRTVSSSTPLSPLGSTSACGSASSSTPAPISSTTPTSKATSPNTQNQTMSGGGSAAPETSSTNPSTTNDSPDGSSNLDATFESISKEVKPSTSTVLAAKQKGISYGISRPRKLTVRAVVFSIVITITVAIMMRQSLMDMGQLSKNISLRRKHA